MKNSEGRVGDLRFDTGYADRHGMFENVKSVICALSGGADSVYLLYYLRELCILRGIELSAAHYNHKLRGEESERDESFVRELCESLGISLDVGSGDVSVYAREHSMSTEEAARTLRYEFLYGVASGRNAECIATAHTANDNAETLLFNLARGTGLKGMCGIPPVRGGLIRPVLDRLRDEIEHYLHEKNIAYVEDSSNAQTYYARNRLRHEAVPVLNSVNEGFVRNANRASALMRRDEEYLEGLAADLAERESNERGLRARALTEAHASVSTRVIRRLYGRGLTERNVSDVLRFCEGGERAELHLPSLCLVREQGRLSVKGMEQDGSFADTEAVIGKNVRIEGTEFHIFTEKLDKADQINSSLNTFFFNYESICGKLNITPMRAGDKIRLAGRGVTKKLSDLFGERKLTRAERTRTFVLRDECGVVAVQGFGVAERCVCVGGSAVLKIDITDRGQ